jgi:hypothetical protein
VTERLIIRQYPYPWEFLSRAELTFDAAGEDRTPAGHDIADAVNATPGIQSYRMARHSLTVFIVHEALWPWAGIEQAIVAAFAKVLGSDVEVIREDKRDTADRVRDASMRDIEPAAVICDCDAQADAALRAAQDVDR